MAVKLNGAKAYANPSPLLDSGQSGLVFDIWMKGTSSGSLAGRRSGSDGWQLTINASGNIVADVGDATATSTKTVLDDDWHIISVEMDKDNMKARLYIDGSQESEVPVTAYSDATSAQLEIGGSGFSRTNVTIGPARFVKFPVYRGFHTFSPVDEVDDVYTGGLWYFDEFVSGQCWSYSAGAVDEATAATEWADISFTDSNYSFVEGPFQMDVESRSRMILWRAIESDPNAARALKSRGVLRHRSRRGDRFLTAGAFGGRLAEFVPGVWVSPTGLDRDRSTISYDEATVTMTVQIVGQIFWYDNLRGIRAAIAHAIDRQWVERNGPMAHGRLNLVTVESASSPVSSMESMGGQKTVFIIADLEVQMKWTIDL